jgi:hypothetical protein
VAPLHTAAIVRFVRRLLALTLAVIACLTVAIGAAARPAAKSWRTHSKPTAGFSIATPANWLDVTSRTSAVLDQAAKSPELASMVEIARENKVIKLLCADPTGVPNLNVISTVSGPLTLGRLVEMNVAGIKRLSFVKGAVTATAVRLPSGPAQLVRYQEAPQGTVVQTLQYYLVHSGKAYILTYTTLASPDAATLALVTQSARSFRFSS